MADRSLIRASSSPLTFTEVDANKYEADINIVSDYLKIASNSLTLKVEDEINDRLILKTSSGLAASIVHQDTGNSRIGINTTSPQETLDVNGTGLFNKIKIGPGSAQDTVVMNHLDGTPRWQIGVLPVTTGYGAIYGGNVTPSSNNFTLASTGADTKLNGTTAVKLLVNNNSRVDIGSNAVVFNEGSANVDFRVEAQGQTHSLFLDATTTRLHVGYNSTPTGTGVLNVNGPVLIVNDSYLMSRNNADSANINVLKVDTNDDTVLNADSGNKLSFTVAGAEGARLSSFGFVTVSKLFVDGGFEIRDEGSSTSKMQANVNTTSGYTYDLDINDTGIIHKSTSTFRDFYFRFGTLDVLRVGNGKVTVTPAAEAQDTIVMNHSDDAPRWQIGVFPSLASYGVFYGGNTTPSSTNYTLAAKANDAVLNSTSTVRLAVNNGNRINCYIGEVAINEGGNNVDLRVEGENTSHGVFFDASTDRFHVGYNATPTGTATVNVAGDFEITDTQSDSNVGIVRIRDNTAFAADVGGMISLAGKYNSSGAYADFGAIEGLKSNGTDGNFAGYLSFKVRPNGSNMAEIMTVDNARVAAKRPVNGPVYTVAGLPSGIAGDTAYTSDGRKNGEGAGSGTGVAVFHDGSNWIAVDTGQTVAA